MAQRSNSRPIFEALSGLVADYKSFKAGPHSEASKRACGSETVELIFQTSETLRACLSSVCGAQAPCAEVQGSEVEPRLA